MKQTVYYEMIGDYLFEEENGWYHGYGIAAVMPDGSRFVFRDISCDRAAVKRFVDDCNEYELSPIHLADEIEEIFF